MFSLLQKFTTTIIDAYDEFWQVCSSTVSEILGENFSGVIDLVQQWLEKAWFIGDALSGLLALAFDTDIITLVLGSVGIFVGWQLVTWVLNLIT